MPDTLAITVRTHGPLDVRGDEFDSGLFINGSCAGYHWSDCMGSIGQILLAGEACLPPCAADAVLDKFNNGASFTEEDYQVIERLLAPGCYERLLSDAEEAYLYWPTELKAWEEGLNSFYPFETCMVSTFPQARLAAERVAHYRAEIRSGTRPVAIILGIDTKFVIDGHHKLQAYVLEGVNPRVLSYVRRNPPPIAVDEVKKFFPRAHVARKSCLSLKQKCAV